MAAIVSYVPFGLKILKINIDKKIKNVIIGFKEAQMNRKTLRSELLLVVVVLGMTGCATFSTANTNMGMTGCATFSTANTNIWIEYEIPPSKVNYSGEIIMEAQLSDGSKCYVLFDDDISNDSDYYYSILMQDFGWHLNGDKWSGPVLEVRQCKLGYMYLNPKRQVAIYFYPKGTYDAFGVRIEKKTNSY
ncbi:MAG: hypothetical protein LBD07_06390 [Spirochaetaceae bacterium]|jgi:hypothetical protein|nr:hypothetical protein [Spirochaetaceae bacterium]